MGRGEPSSSIKYAEKLVELLQLKQGAPEKYAVKLKEYQIQDTAALMKAIDEYESAVFAEILKGFIDNGGKMPTYMSDLPQEFQKRSIAIFHTLCSKANSNVILEFGKLLYDIALLGASAANTSSLANSIYDPLEPFRTKLQKLMSITDVEKLAIDEKVQLLSLFHDTAQQNLLKKRLKLDQDRFSRLLVYVNNELFPLAFYQAFKHGSDIDKLTQRLPESCHEEFEYYVALSAGLENDCRYDCAKALWQKFTDSDDMTVVGLLKDLKSQLRASILIHMYQLLSTDKLNTDDKSKLHDLLNDKLIKEFDNDIVEYILRRHYEDKIELDTLLEAMPETIKQTVREKTQLTCDFIRPELMVDFIQLQDDLVSERDLNAENSFLAKFKQLNEKCSDEDRHLTDADMADLVLGLFFHIDRSAEIKMEPALKQNNTVTQAQLHAMKLELDAVLVRYSLQAEFRQALIRHYRDNYANANPKYEPYMSYVLPGDRINFYYEIYAEDESLEVDKARTAAASGDMAIVQTDAVNTVAETNRNVDATSQKQAKVTKLKDAIQDVLTKLELPNISADNKLTYSRLRVKDKQQVCVLLDYLYDLQCLNATELKTYIDEAQCNPLFLDYEKRLITYAIDTYVYTGRLPAYIVKFEPEVFKRILWVARLLPDSREQVEDRCIDQIMSLSAHDYNKLPRIFAHVLYEFSGDTEKTLTDILAGVPHAHEQVAIASYFCQQPFLFMLKHYNELLSEKFDKRYHDFVLDIYQWGVEAVYREGEDKDFIQGLLPNVLRYGFLDYLDETRFLPDTPNAVKYAYYIFILQVMRKQRAAYQENHPAASFSSIKHLGKLSLDIRVQVILQIKRVLQTNGYPHDMQEALQTEFDQHIKTTFDDDIKNYLIVRHFEDKLALEKTDTSSLIDGVSTEMQISMLERIKPASIEISCALRLYLFMIREYLYDGHRRVPDAFGVKCFIENLRHPLTDKPIDLTDTQLAELLLGAYISVKTIPDKHERFNTDSRKQLCQERLDAVMLAFNLQEKFHDVIVAKALAGDIPLETSLEFVFPLAREELRDRYASELEAQRAREEAQRAREEAQRAREEAYNSIDGIQSDDETEAEETDAGANTQVPGTASIESAAESVDGQSSDSGPSDAKCQQREKLKVDGSSKSRLFGGDVSSISGHESLLGSDCPAIGKTIIGKHGSGRTF